MSRNQYTGGGKLLFRLACLFCLILFSFAQAVLAESAFDVKDLEANTSLLPYISNFTAEKPSVGMQTPAGPLDLKSNQKQLPFQWKIVVLTNTSSVTKELVLTIQHQKFTGSKLFNPDAPGSVLLGIVETGTSRPPEIGATGEDAYGFVLGPKTSKSIALEVTSAPPDVVLWTRDFYDQQTRSASFFRGAILGIAMLLGLSMLLLYSARARLEFVSGGLFSAAALAFMLLEAGYFPQPRIYFASVEVTPVALRAIVESLLAIGLLFYLATLADIRQTAPRLRRIFLSVAALGLALPVYGIFEPVLVATVARIAFAAVALIGLIFLYRAHRERPEGSAFSLWLVIVLWTLVAAIALFIKDSYYLMSPVLILGLTLVLAFMSLRFVRYATGSGFLSQSLFQDAGRGALALAGAQQYVWDWNAEDRELYLSEELEQALGHLPRLLHQSNAETLLDMMHPADRQAYTATLASAELRGRGAIRQELRLHRADGSYRWFELRARGIANSENRMIRCIGTLSDITGTKRAEERLLIDAVYDQVTGLPNRALFLDRLKRELSKPFADNLYVILVDLDRFKNVNDGLGHDAGDSLLNSVGRRIETLLKPEDTVARLPGDQFAVLFAGSVIERDIASFIEQMRAAIARPIAVNNQEIFLTASLGASSCTEPGLTADQLMKDATIALYEAKRRGKGSIEFFQPHMRDNRSELVALEAELRRALERNEIEVHYQPIARLNDMDLAGFEALVRWRHPVLGLLAPESFLNLAEQTGMINEIGRFVLNEATRQLGIWQRAFKPSDPLFVAVNVSASQLVETDIVGDIRAAIGREAIDSRSLKIEITESIVMQFPEQAAALLQQIKQLGAGLSCDDFGTGHSSLSSLRNLPFDTLKVDRSFIMSEPEDERAAVILAAIVTMAHNLNLTTVAEGIENQSQVDRLGELQCDFGQGFFIGQPITAKQVTESLAAQPYAQDPEKTVISTLWEHASADPAATAINTELTTEVINKATREREEEVAAKAVAPAERARKSIDALPTPGAAPMAPRVSKQEPVELPSISALKNPAKPPEPEEEKPEPASETDSPSSVA